MKKHTATITLHMVSSLDGYIAKKDGDISWMQPVREYKKGVELQEEDINKFLESIDCYVMGSHTYEHALELGWPYGDKPVYVLSTRNLNSMRPGVQFYSGSLETLVQKQLKTQYQNIWLVGGSQLAKDFIEQDLVDDIVISIVPILLGDGAPFFGNISDEKLLQLENVKAYKSGIVEMHYTFLKD